jgi:hypothetical protein
MDGIGGESRWGENSSTKDVNSEWMEENKVRGEGGAIFDIGCWMLNF